MANEFYTTSTLFTLGGTSMAVWVITSVFGDVFGEVLGRKMRVRVKKWLALALSLIFALIGASLTSNISVLTWVVAVVNGFLIYLTAIGLNAVTVHSAKRSGESPRPTSGEKKSGFTDSWW